MLDHEYSISSFPDLVTEIESLWWKRTHPMMVIYKFGVWDQQLLSCLLFFLPYLVTISAQSKYNRYVMRSPFRLFVFVKHTKPNCFSAHNLVFIVWIYFRKGLKFKQLVYTKKSSCIIIEGSLSGKTLHHQYSDECRMIECRLRDRLLTWPWRHKTCNWHNFFKV